MKLREKLCSVAAAGLIASLSIAGFAGVASADSGSNVSTVPFTFPTAASNQTDVQNDEPVQFSVPAGVIASTAGQTEFIIECNDPGASISAASGSYLKSQITEADCDALTQVSATTSAGGALTTPSPNPPYFPGTPQSVIDGAPVVYSLPNLNDLGETTNSGQTCDLSDPCIFYIGPNPQTPTDSPGATAYSVPFYVDQNQDYLAGTQAPGTPTPEVPLGILLPLAATGLLGGAYVINRRRKVGIEI